jgi:hypothetical protein
MSGDSGSLKAAARRGWLRLQNALSARGNRTILEEREKAEDDSVCRECADLDRCGDWQPSSSSRSDRRGAIMILRRDAQPAFGSAPNA